MGFRRSIVISDQIPQDVRLSVIQHAQAKWAGISLPVSNRQYSDRALIGGPELTDYLFEDDEHYEQAASESFAFADGIPVMSGDFPGITFVYIDADCFGGTCLYSGYAATNGEIVSRMPPHRKGHRKLLRNVGLRIWHDFAPLRRDYFGT